MPAAASRAGRAEPVVQGAGEPGHRQPGDAPRAARGSVPRGGQRQHVAEDAGRQDGAARQAARVEHRDAGDVDPLGADLLAHPRATSAKPSAAPERPACAAACRARDSVSALSLSASASAEDLGDRRRAHLAQRLRGVPAGRAPRAPACRCRGTPGSPAVDARGDPDAVAAEALRKARAALIAGSAGEAAPGGGAGWTGPSWPPPRSARPRCPPAPSRARSGARAPGGRRGAAGCWLTPRAVRAAAVCRGQVVQPGPPGDGGGRAAAGGQQRVATGHEDHVVRRRAGDRPRASAAAGGPPWP